VVIVSSIIGSMIIVILYHPLIQRLDEGFAEKLNNCFWKHAFFFKP